MRAAVLQGKTLTVRQMPDPSPLAGQLLVRPLFTGICGSDLSVRLEALHTFRRHGRDGARRWSADPARPAGE